MEVTCCAARLDDHVYVIAEDWGSHAFAREAATLAVKLLWTGSGYAGKRDLDLVADYIKGLLEIPNASPYGCCLMTARVIDRKASG